MFAMLKAPECLGSRLLWDSHFFEHYSSGLGAALARETDALLMKDPDLATDVLAAHLHAKFGLAPIELGVFTSIKLDVRLTYYMDSNNTPRVGYMAEARVRVLSV
jgi:hypothetical protein